LLVGHYSLGFQVAIVLDLSEDHVAHAALNRQIELVLPELVCCSTHPIVWPSGVHLAMQVLVVLNLGETLLENGRVQQWVESVTAHGQSVDLSWDDTTVLLRSQVLYDP